VQRHQIAVYLAQCLNRSLMLGERLVGCAVRCQCVDDLLNHP
jgi:hypothetical protein